MKTNIIQLLILIFCVILLYKLYKNYNNIPVYIPITNYNNKPELTPSGVFKNESDTPRKLPKINKKSQSDNFTEGVLKKTAKNKHEKECRRILESIYKKSFHSVRPDFLEYTNGHNLELDMYNESLKLAVEYQGIQHYKFNKFFHKSYDDFINLINRDTWKAQRCKELNIKLITVPYTIKFENLREYIIKQLNNK
jgi:hypothetical protein